MSNNSNSKNPTAKKEKLKPSNITISTGSQVFITLGSYNQLNSGLQTATAKNNNADNSLHYIDTKKKTPTNNAQTTKNYFIQQKKNRAVSGSSSNNANMRNVFNSKVMTDFQQHQIQNQQQQKVFSPKNIQMNNVQSDNQNLQNPDQIVSNSSKQQANKAHDALNISNHSVGKRYVSSSKQYQNSVQTQGSNIIKIQKQGQSIEKNQKKILKSQKSLFQMNQGQQQSFNTQNTLNDQVQKQKNQQYANFNESALGNFAAHDKRQAHEIAQVSKKQQKDQEIFITDDYSPQHDENGTDGKANNSGICNQSFQFGVGHNFGQQFYNGAQKPNRGGSSGSTNKTKSRYRSGSNKMKNITHRNQDSKSNNPRKKITINTNTAQVLMDQQNLDRGVLTTKTTSDGQKINFKNIPSSKLGIKGVITPSAVQNNLVKKGIVIQTSNNLPTKKTIVKKANDVNQQKPSRSQNKETSKTQPINNGVESSQGKMGFQFQLQNNNIFQDGLNYVLEKESLTTKNDNQEPSIKSQFYINGMKFNIDNGVIQTQGNQSENFRDKGHSNIMKIFKKQQTNNVQKQDQKKNPKKTFKSQKSNDFERQSLPNSNDGAINNNQQVNTSFNGPYTVMNNDQEFQVIKRHPMTFINSNNLSQKKYKTITEDFLETNEKEAQSHFEHQELKIHPKQTIVQNMQKFPQPPHQQQQVPQKSLQNQLMIPKLSQKQQKGQLAKSKDNIQSKQDDHKKKIMNTSGNDSRNISQKFVQNHQQSSYHESIATNDQRKKNIILSFGGHNKVIKQNQDHQFGAFIDKNKKISSHKHQTSQVKSVERNNSSIANQNIFQLQEQMKDWKKSHYSKTHQPSKHLFDKLKNGFQQIIYNKDGINVLPSTSNNNGKISLKIKPIDQGPQNISCEVTDLKSVGSTKSKLSKNSKQQYQINLKNINNNFQNLSKFKKNQQISIQQTATNKAKLMKNSKSYNKYLFDQLDCNISSPVSNNNQNQNLGSFQKLNINTIKNKKKQVNIPESQVAQNTLIKQMNMLSKSPITTHQQQNGQNKINIKLNLIQKSVKDDQKNQQMIKEGSKQQFSSRSETSSKDSNNFNINVKEINNIQKSLPDLIKVGTSSTEGENFTFKNSQDHDNNHVIPTIKKSNLEKQIELKNYKSETQPKTKSTVGPKKQKNKIKYYEEELKKRDDLVKMLCQKIQGMESKINLLTINNNIASSMNDSKEQQKVDNNMSPVNTSKGYHSFNQDTSKEFVKIIKDLIKTGQNKNDITEQSIKRLQDASLSSQQTALLLRCMQLHSKQSKSNHASVNESDKQFDNLLDQFTDTDPQLQQIMSMIRQNSEEEGETEYNNLSKNLLDTNQILDRRSNQVINGDFKFNDNTLGINMIGQETGEFADILNSFELQKEQNEFLNQAFTDIQRVDIETNDDKLINSRDKKFKAIEHKINDLQTKLNDFNQFNKNPNRIAELRRYCTTSITHTTKTISEGISSGLLKSGSNSGGQSKNKTINRHFQSTSNLDQNSLITVTNGDLNPNQFTNGTYIQELYKASSGSKKFDIKDQLSPPNQNSVENSPEQLSENLEIKVHQVSVPNLHLNNLSKIVKNSGYTKLVNEQSQNLKSEEDDVIKELEVLMNRRPSNEKDEEEKQIITDNKNLYSVIEKEWLEANEKSDAKIKDHDKIDPVNKKSTNIQLTKQQLSDMKPKLKFNQTQKLTLRPNIITNSISNQSGTSGQYGWPNTSKQARFGGNESFKISVKNDSLNENQKIRKDESGCASFLSWNNQNEENVFYKTQSDKGNNKQANPENEQTQNATNQENSMANITSDPNVFTKGISKQVTKVKTLNLNSENINVQVNGKQQIQTLQVQSPSDVKQKIKLVGKINTQNAENKPKQNPITNKHQSFLPNFYQKQAPEPTEQLQQLITQQQSQNDKKIVSKVTKIKKLGDMGEKRAGIRRNNYMIQQRSSSIEEEKVSSDQNVHSMERQLQRLNELEAQEHVLMSNEISMIENNQNSHHGVIMINETSLESNNEGQLTNQSIRCLQGQGQVKTRRNANFHIAQLSEHIPPTNPHPPQNIRNKESLTLNLSRIQRTHTFNQ